MDAHESENPKPPLNVGESSNDGKNKHGRSKSSWGLSTAVHGVGFVAKKVINNRLTDSLWHSRKSSSSASCSSDASDDKRENHSHETASHHYTWQPSLNVEDKNTPLKGRNVNAIDSNVVDKLEDLQQDVVDQLDDTKPTDGSHVKPVNQHRWPSTTVSNVVNRLGNSKPSTIWPSTTNKNVVNQSENLEPPDGSHARPVNQHRWPGTVGSNVLNKIINNPHEASRVPKLNKKSFPNFASKPLPESLIDATNLPSPSSSSLSRADDGRLKTDTVIESQPSSPNKSYVLASRGVSSSWVEPSHIFRGASLTPTTRGASDTTTTTTRGVSPTPISGTDHRARDVSPTSVKPSKASARRHFFSANILSVFTKIVDNKKEKHVANPKEVAQHLELLYNIQVQWQFANASAEAALDLQRETAEKSLSDVWRATLELRDSLASKKIDITLLILQLKLYAILYRQMAYIDEWASIQKEHESALYATTNDLQARSLSLPITGGVKADIKGLKLILFSTIQVLQATVSCIQSTLSKLDKTHFLASELANLVLHERALLDEYEIFLASAAPLHIEECSLRSYLLQFNQTSITE